MEGLNRPYFPDRLGFEVRTRKDLAGRMDIRFVGHDPSDVTRHHDKHKPPYVLQFKRWLFPDDQDQTLETHRSWPYPLPDPHDDDVNYVENFQHINITREQVRHLDLNKVVPEPMAKMPLVQRQRLDDPKKPYEHTGRWLVSIAGLPAHSILRFWNAHVAEPYIAALHTVQDGQPVSVMPKWDLSDKDKDSASWMFVYSVCDYRPCGCEARPGVWDPGKDECKRPKQVDCSDPCGHTDHPDRIAYRLQSIQPVYNAKKDKDDNPEKYGKVAAATLPGFLTHDGEPLRVALQIYNKHLGWEKQEPDDEEEVAEIEKRIWEETNLFAFAVLHRTPDNPESTTNERTSRIGSLDLTFPECKEKKDDKPRLPDPKDPKADQEVAYGITANLIKKVDPPLRVTIDLLPVLDMRVDYSILDLAPGGQDGLPGEQYVPTGYTGPKDEEQEERVLEDRFIREQPVIIPVQAKAKSEKKQFILRVDEGTAEDRSHTVRMRLSRDPEVDKKTQRSQRPDQDKPLPVVIIDRHPFLVARVEVPPFRGAAQGDDINEIGNWSNSAPAGSSWELSGSTEGFRLYLPPQALGEAMEKGIADDGFKDIEKNKPIDFRFSPPARMTVLPSYFEQRFAEAPWNLRRILGYPGQRAPGAGVVRMQFELLYGMTCTVDYPFLRLAELSARLGHIPGRLERGSEIPTLSGFQKDKYDDYREDWSKTYAQYLSRLSILEPWDANQPEGLVLDTGVTYDLRRKADLKYPISENVETQTNEKGLPGGVGWGFESANIYEALWREPRSNAGKLANPYFSALGGWGYQKASFNNGLTTIYSNTAMGRTFFYSIERIGRIGVFWNLAKHVIIYERTVKRARQFESEQEPHEGRVILRKVDEFVEILEPERRYPDFDAPTVTRGCVRACTFKSRIIRVTSRWGSDVRKEGWQVPLWQAGVESDLDLTHLKEVYPKPQIVLEVEADAEGGTPVVSCELAEPETLTFFTYTVPGADTRTDLWPPIHGIDCTDQPPPVPPAVRAGNRSNLDAMLLDAAAVEPGYRPFTFAVTPISKQVNMVAGRAEEALGALLRNVTMVRAKAKHVQRQLERLDENTQRVLRDLNDVPAKIDDVFEDILARVPPEGKIEAQIKNELQSAIERLKQKSGLGSILDNIKEYSEAKNLLRKAEALCQRLVGQATRTLDLGSNKFIEVINQWERELLLTIRTQWDDIDGNKKEAIHRVKAHIRIAQEYFVPLGSGLQEIRNLLQRAYKNVGQFKTQFEADVAELILLAKNTTKEQKELRLKELAAFRKKERAALHQLEVRLSSVRHKVLGKIADGILDEIRKVSDELDKQLDAVEKVIEETPDQFEAQLGTLETGVVTAINDLAGKIEPKLKTAKTHIGGFDGKLRKYFQEEVIDKLDPTIKLEEGDNYLVRLLDALGNKIEDLIDDPLKKVIRRGELETIVTDQANAVRGKIRVAINEAKGQIIHEDFCKALEKLLPDELDEFEEVLKYLKSGGSAFLEELKEKLKQKDLPVDELRKQIVRIRDEAQQRLAPYIERIQEGVSDIVRETGLGRLKNTPIWQEADQTLRLLRAFADAPKVPNLDFNRQRIAYYFDEARKAVGTTPMTALVNRVGTDLKALGLRVPTTELLDRCIPQSLQNFNLSDILPDFAGLRLENLFSGIRMPALANENVKITHRIDKQRLRATLHAQVNVPLPKPATVFSYGPVTVRLTRARFFADVRIQAGVGSPPKRTIEGIISGHWEMHIGGTPLMTFVDTDLRFDENNRIKFTLSPNKIRLHGVVQFISDLVSRLRYSDGGFSIRVIERDGMPIGVESLLDLPLPDVHMAAFGLTNLRLSAFFRLVVEPGGSRGVDFMLALGLAIGRKTAPFSLTIFILGGGGWFEVQARYYPLRKQISTSVTIGAVASAILALNLGPIRGGVYVYFGVSAEFQSQSGSRSHLAISLIFLIRGEVRLLGFVSIGLVLMLEARYNRGTLVGRGSFYVEIKICRWFKFKYRGSVEYRLAQGRSGGSTNAAASGEDPYGDAADRYLGMYE